MATEHLGKVGRWALLLLPIVLVPVAIFASVPWLRQQSDAVALGISAAAAIFVMGYSVLVAERMNRGLDEVQLAGQRFAHTKGMTIVSIGAVLVMLFPPLMNALVSLANTIGAGSPDKAVKLGITIGFMLVVILQTLGMAAVSVWW